MNKNKDSYIQIFNIKFLPILIIILLPLLFFGSASIGQSIIVSGDFTGSDLLDLHYPFKVALHQAIKNQTLPLWTPYLSNGFPLLAEGQTGILYPPNLVFSLLPPFLALNYSVIFAFLSAGIGTWLYARLIFKDRFRPLVAAIIFMFSGFFITRHKHINLIAVASLFPLSLYFQKKFFQTKKFQWIIASSIILALMLLAGHPQMAFYCFFVYLLFFLFEFTLVSRKEGLARLISPTMVSLFLIIIITGGLSAIQTLPTFELINRTERLEFTFQTATAYPYDPMNLITLISPYYFGNPATGSYKENIRIMGIFWENSSYIGLLPLILVLLAIFKMIKKKEKNLQFWFFSFLGLFSLLLMLGKFTPLFKFFWTFIPGFSYFRFPTRFNLFLIFSLSLLAAKESSSLVNRLVRLKFAPRRQEEKPTKNKEREELALVWPLDKAKTQALIIAFILIDLFVFGKNYFGFIPASQWVKKPEVAEFLQADESLFRLYSVTQYGQSPYQILGWKGDTSPLLAIREALPPNNNLIYYLSSFSDRGWFEGGLNFTRRNKLERFLVEEVDQIKVSQVLGLLNIKYIISFAETGGFEMERVKEIDLGELFATTIKVYENKQFLPRLYFVPEAKVVKEESALFNHLTSLEFHPLRTVLLEKEPKKIPPPFSGVMDQFKQDNQLKIKKYSPLEVIIETDLKNDGFLVLSDTFYPGWKVKIDQKKGEILPANYLFRAVEMTPGKHEVRFVYQPLSFKIGAGISGATLGAIILSTLAFGQRRLSLSKKGKKAKGNRH